MIVFLGRKRLGGGNGSVDFDGQSREDFRIGSVFGQVILLPKIKLIGASFFNDEDTALLKSVSLQIALDSEPLDAALSCPSDPTQNSRDKSQPPRRFETQVLIALFPLINEEVSVEEISLNEFLDAELFQPDSHQAGVVLVKQRLDGRDLSRTKPTIHSSKSSKEDDDSSTFLPNFSKGGLRTIRCFQ